MTIADQIRTCGITAYGSSLGYERRSAYQDKDEQYEGEESIDQRSASVVPNPASSADYDDVERAASSGKAALENAQARPGFPARRDNGNSRHHPFQPRSDIRHWLMHLPAQLLLDGMEFRPHPLYQCASPDHKVTFRVRATVVREPISPLLANAYLHYVFDMWAEKWREKVAHADMIIVRYGPRWLFT